MFYWVHIPSHIPFVKFSKKLTVKRHFPARACWKMTVQNRSKIRCKNCHCRGCSDYLTPPPTNWKFTGLSEYNPLLLVAACWVTKLPKIWPLPAGGGQYLSLRWIVSGEVSKAAAAGKLVSGKHLLKTFWVLNVPLNATSIGHCCYSSNQHDDHQATPFFAF